MWATSTYPHTHCSRQLSDYFPNGHTEGILWFPDLGAADPLHILCVVCMWMCMRAFSFF